MRSGSICRSGRAGVVVVAAAAALAMPPSPPAAAQADGANSGSAPSAFRSQTDLVALQVSVVDAAGRPVPDLRREDFAIFDEGARQPVALFATSSAPLDVMLLLDASGSMLDRIAAARAAALDLVRSLRSGDRAAFVVFSEDVHLVQPLTEDRAALELAIRRAAPSGGTALHEALYISLRELARAQRSAGSVRRQALILLSDGEDTSSRNVSEQDVLDAARRSAVTVFTILPATPVDDDPLERLGRNAPGAEFNLRTLARETGGRSFTRTPAEELGTAYRQIADELSQQYVVAYVAPPGGGGFRRVAVQVVDRPELRARTRGGYLLPAARARSGALPSRGHRQ